MSQIPSSPPTVSVLCIEHLHEFEVPNFTERVECPICGCRYVRLASQSNMTRTVVDVAEPYRLDTTTWVSQLPEKGSRKTQEDKG